MLERIIGTMATQRPLVRVAAAHRHVTNPVAQAKVLVLALFLGGCAAVGPNYTQPKVEMPGAWSRGSAAEVLTKSDRESLARWWRSFGDPTLSSLVQQALEGSNALRVAQARLREARARRVLAGAGLFPTVTASAGAGRSRSSGQTTAGRSSTNELYSAGFDASWEPDVFGGTRRGVEAAQADLESVQANLNNTEVSLAAEVTILGSCRPKCRSERWAIVRMAPMPQPLSRKR